MFTGIVQGKAETTSVTPSPGLIRVEITFPSDAVGMIELGASVAIDGVCLTVAKIAGATLAFDVMQESLDRSTLQTLRVGTQVNFERSLKFGQEIGGHLVSGHVDFAAEVVRVETPSNNHIITFRAPPQWLRYIFPKGYVALNGASLTVARCDKQDGTFEVCLIPETLRLTTFGTLGAGDKVNVEIDRQTQVIVDTVTEYLKSTG